MWTASQKAVMVLCVWCCCYFNASVYRHCCHLFRFHAFCCACLLCFHHVPLHSSPHSCQNCHCCSVFTTTWCDHIAVFWSSSHLCCLCSAGGHCTQKYYQLLWKRVRNDLWLCVTLNAPLVQPLLHVCGWQFAFTFGCLRIWMETWMVCSNRCFSPHSWTARSGEPWKNGMPFCAEERHWV